MGILLLSGKRTGSVTSLSPAPKLDRGFIALVEQGTRDGLLDVDLRINKVYIEPITWNNMDAKTKKWFATNMAVYCQSKGLNGKWVKIYDKQSAKKLAEYDAWGFEVY
ncbi:MAG: hypothetical protein NTZ35_02125 [Ignavibacteriales bacterium]|nr:hypothetical protein [Ignavibacteriales bacterium]